MTSFVERAIERAGLGGVLPARRRGDIDAVRAELAAAGEVDLLVLGALADAIRAAECGDVVRVHPVAAADVHWVPREGRSELDLLRAVAIARITSARGQRIGVEWGQAGLEVPQVALGFGATDLSGPITRKSGDLIDETELKKVKGQGLVAKVALRRLEIAAVLANAGRVCQFTDETAPTPAPKRTEEAAHV